MRAIILLPFLLITHGISAQKITYQEMQSAIENRVIIEFKAMQALPAKGRSVNLNSFNNTQMLFTLDSASADLPYFGTAQIAGYGTASGIVFDGPVEEDGFKLKDNLRKEQMVISFRVKSDSDLFRCNFTIQSGGSASLMVVPNNRDRINYVGSFKINQSDQRTP